jgi:hypothetical protein
MCFKIQNYTILPCIVFSVILKKHTHKNEKFYEELVAYVPLYDTGSIENEIITGIHREQGYLIGLLTKMREYTGREEGDVIRLMFFLKGKRLKHNNNNNNNNTFILFYLRATSTIIILFVFIYIDL